MHSITEYHRYLASREWALKREAVRRRSGNHCERCLVGPQDAVHHLTYEHKFNESLEDLQAICDPCHAFLSGVSDIDPVAGPGDYERDRRLVISIRRETPCEFCLFDTDGNYSVCHKCRRISCAACTFDLGGRGVCVDHAEGPR